MIESERLKGRNPAKLRKAIATAQEDMQIKKLVDFQKRQAKGKKKGKRPRSFDDEASSAAGKKKKKSFFDDELTNVQNARAFRHQPKSFKSDAPSTKAGKFKDNKKMPKRNIPKGKGNPNANKSNRKFGQKMNKKNSR